MIPPADVSSARGPSTRQSPSTLPGRRVAACGWFRRMAPRSSVLRDRPDRLLLEVFIPEGCGTLVVPDLAGLSPAERTPRSGV